MIKKYEELNWPFGEKSVKSTVEISTFGSLLWVKFTKYNQHRQVEGELRVKRQIEMWLNKHKDDKRVYEVKSSPANILIYCNNKADCDSLKVEFENLNKKYYNF